MMAKPISISDEEWEKWQEAKEKVIQTLRSYNLSCGAILNILRGAEDEVSGIAFGSILGEDVGNI